MTAFEVVLLLTCFWLALWAGWELRGRCESQRREHAVHMAVLKSLTNFEAFVKHLREIQREVEQEESAA